MASRSSISYMDAISFIDSVVARLCQSCAAIRPLSSASWVDGIEHKLELRSPALFRSLLERYAFPLLDVGEVELFANEDDGSQYDLTVAPFGNPFMSPWLLKHRFIYIGHPYLGNYDPICFDLSHRQIDAEPPIVLLTHEDILLERDTVNRKIVAANFLTLLERAHAV